MAQLEQKTNTAFVRGRLNSMDLKIRPQKANPEYDIPAQNAIMGRLDILVQTGEKDLVIPFSVFAREFTRAGAESNAYKGLKTVMEEYKSIADTGSASEATHVEIGLGSIEANTFATADGERIISYPQVSSMFFNRVSEATLLDEARFDMYIYLADISPEVDDETGVNTGRLDIQAIVPKFGGKVDIIPFKVEGKEAVTHIGRNWKVGQTVRVAGDIDFSVRVIKEKVEGMGFGEPVYEERTERLSELVIRTGSAKGLPPETAFDSDLIDAAVAERAEWLETLKDKALSRNESKAKGPGFGGTTGPGKTDTSIDDFIGDMGFGV